MKSYNAQAPRAASVGAGLRGLVLALLAAVFAVIAGGAQGLGGEREAQPGASDTLMLVRDWDPASGLLIGWLPVHNAAIQLELLVKSPAPHFDADEAVYLVWPRRLNYNPQKAQLLISPAPRTFEGQSWLPATRDPNLVLIGKSLYLIRKIILGESKWRAPARNWVTSGRRVNNGASQ